MMNFPTLILYEDIAFVFLRIMVAVIFLSSGWGHIVSPKERARSIGMSTAFTFGLGMIEAAGALMLILGIYIQVAAIALSFVMVGAIYKKIFVWRKGFFAKEGYGWHYDALLLAALFVFLITGG